MDQPPEEPPPDASGLDAMPGMIACCEEQKHLMMRTAATGRNNGCGWHARGAQMLPAPGGELAPGTVQLTRCVTMQEAVPVTRPLQNHLPLFTHLTTEAALWMPQYLCGWEACLGSGLREHYTLLRVHNKAQSGLGAGH